MPDNSALIAQIDNLLATGLSQTVEDGHSTTIRSRAELLRERRRLLRSDTSTDYADERNALKEAEQPKSVRFD